MSYMAVWGPKGFLISPTKIVTLDDFSSSVELKSDSENDTSGKSPTNTRGLIPQIIEFSVTYTRAAGTDPRTQLEEWQSLVGEMYPLYIGDKRFGPSYLILKAVSSEDYVFSAKGDILSVTIGISLEEYTGSASSAATRTTSSNSSNNSNQQSAADRAASVYEDTVERQRAMDATASASDRQRLANPAEQAYFGD